MTELRQLPTITASEITTVDTVGALPASGVQEGSIRYVKADDTLYTFDGVAWAPQTGGGGGSNQSGTFDWLFADGNIKTVTHNFNTTSLLIQIYDLAADQEVFVDEVSFDDANNVTLTAVGTIPAGGFSVYIQEVAA